MKFTKSIQTRVFLIFGSFTLLLSLVYAGMNVLVAYVIEDEVLAKVLAYEARAIEKAYREQGKVIQPRVDYMKLYLKPELAPKEIAQAFKNKTLTDEVFTQDEVHYHIQFLFLDKSTEPILVAEVAPFLTVSNASKALLFLVFGVFIIALISSLWLAYRIAIKTTRPISTLAKEVELQQEQGEAVEFSARRSNDEIGFLANTIENTLTSLKQSVKRESDFNRDVSHELRTPLTVINNTLALSDNRTLTRFEIEQLNESAKQMNHIVSTLLTLARAESVEIEQLLLRPLLEDCVLSLHHKLVEKQFNINLEVAIDYKVAASNQLVVLLVNNLIENAIRHSSGTELLVKLEGDKLIFENQTDRKIEASTVDSLTEQNVKQSDSSGLGQGLYLVRRVIEELNWDYEIASDKGKFQFIILFQN